MTHVPLLNQAQSSPAKTLTLLQRNRTALCQSKSRKQIESVKGTLSSSGQPLDLNTKVFFENQFEKDFSHVRVHSNSKSAHSANAISAAAYTVGSSIAFGRNQYQPNTVGGRRLLAHELTHVAQNGNRSLDLGNLKLGNADCLAEREAAWSETTFGSANDLTSSTIRSTHGLGSSIIRRRSIAQDSGSGQSMASRARQDALSIIDVLTEFHISDKQESEVIKKLQYWGKTSTRNENYLDIILTILQGRSLTMKYLGLFESAPSTYLDQLFEEMEDQRSLDLRELIQTHSVQFASYRNRKGVSVFGSVTSAVVNEVRSFQEFLISKMRNMISELAGQERSIAEAVLDLIEGISDVLIGTLFFLTGVVSGVFSEIWSMIEGFAQLIIGILKALWLLVSNFEKFKENGAALLEALWNLPAAIKALITGWQDEFDRSTEDQQIVMVGELLGRTIATFATFGFVIGKAGKLSKMRVPVRVNVPVPVPARALAGIGSEGFEIGTKMLSSSVNVGKLAQPAAGGGVAASSLLGKSKKLTRNSKAKIKRNQTSKFRGDKSVRGFLNHGEVMERLGNLKNRLKQIGLHDSKIGIRGSSVTGESSKGAGKFFENRKSDIDFFVINDAYSSKFPLDNSLSVKPKYLPENVKQVLDDFGKETSKQLGRKSSVRFIDSTAAAAMEIFMLN